MEIKTGLSSTVFKDGLRLTRRTDRKDRRSKRDSCWCEELVIGTWQIRVELTASGFIGCGY